MNFNNKYLKKYSTFKLQLQDEVRQEQPTFPENWVQEQLQPTLVQFLNLWHGSEVRRLSFYVEETPLKVYGAVEYSLELRHKIDPQNPETFKVSGYSFNFFPTDSDPSEKSPFETWEQLNAQKKLVKYPEVSGMRAAVAFSEGVNGAISIVNTLKDIGTVIYQAVSAKKEKNDKRLAAINEAGHDLDVIFKGTCNVFIHKNTDKHKSFPNFYGVLFEDTFTIENTSYKVYVFREGTFSINEKCRREHHWFATGEDNNFARLSFWRKRLYTFWSPKRSFHFERQGKILTDSQLEKAIQLADNYFKPASTTPENPSDKRPQPNGA